MALGTLRVSKGALVWFPNRTKKGHKVEWEAERRSQALRPGHQLRHPHVPERLARAGELLGGRWHVAARGEDLHEDEPRRRSSWAMPSSSMAIAAGASPASRCAAPSQPTAFARPTGSTASVTARESEAMADSASPMTV